MSPVKYKMLLALNRASRRFALGIVGTWCVIGPIVLFLGSLSVNWKLSTILVVSLLLCYGIVLRMCLESGLPRFRELTSETGLALCFIIIGELGSEITGFLTPIKDEMAVVYAFIGFFIAELISPRSFTKALSEKFSSLFRKSSANFR